MHHRRHLPLLIAVTLGLPGGAHAAPGDAPAPGEPSSHRSVVTRRLAGGLGVGIATAPFGDDDQFSGGLVTGFLGARLLPYLTVGLRADYTADEVSDPFDMPLDRKDQLLVGLPSVRLGRSVWVELGVGAMYRWRSFRNGSEDNGAKVAGDLLVGVSLGPQRARFRFEAALGILTNAGIAAQVGVGF